MSRLLPLLIVLALTSNQLRANDSQVLSRIAFGSCAKETKPQPIWNSIVKTKPQMFLFIGDNIYGDTEDMAVLKKKWSMLGAVPGFKKLRQTCPILATWDDHDYGANDAGVEYKKKRESQKIFLDFFNEPADSPRRTREGIYDAKLFGPKDKRIQIILLDTRYFRSKLIKRKGKGTHALGDRGPYAVNNDKTTTLLGDAQWVWLEEQLKVPAQLRIIASSIQVIPDEHWWEKWGNFPHERERLFKLIQKTNANGVVFISGDRHSAEISRTGSRTGYPIYDITSSSLNQPQDWHNELNRHRVGVKYVDINFGTIEIDWSQPDPPVSFHVRDGNGHNALLVRETLSNLQPKK